MKEDDPKPVHAFQDEYYEKMMLRLKLRVEDSPSDEIDSNRYYLEN